MGVKKSISSHFIFKNASWGSNVPCDVSRQNTDISNLITIGYYHVLSTFIFSSSPKYSLSRATYAKSLALALDALLNIRPKQHEPLLFTGSTVDTRSVHSS